jgi:hypothetical protein
MRRNSDDSEKPSPVACRSSPGLSGDEIAPHRFSYDRALPGVLDTIVCADIAGKEMQEDA